MTGDLSHDFHVLNSDNIYDDPYFGMHLTFSGHPNDLYNGEYEALDYLYNSEKPYTYFKNNNGMYLYYLPFDGESEGLWNLHDNED